MEMNLPDFNRTDHQQHAIAGAAIAAGSIVIVDMLDPKAPRVVRVLVPILATAVISAAKEVYDHQHPDRHTAETGDFLAGMAGGLTVTVFSWTW